jgi:hypothetical protein
LVGIRFKHRVGRLGQGESAFKGMKKQLEKKARGKETIGKE